MGIRPEGFHHLAIQVNDVERASSFYCSVLGFEERVRHHSPDGSLRSIWVALPGAEGFFALEKTAESPEPTPFRHGRPGLHLIALRISRDDRARLKEELVKQGVNIDHESRWTVYIRDPEGNRIGLSHHPQDPL